MSFLSVFSHFPACTRLYLIYTDKVLFVADNKLCTAWTAPSFSIEREQSSVPSLQFLGGDVGCNLSVFGAILHTVLYLFNPNRTLQRRVHDRHHDLGDHCHSGMPAEHVYASQRGYKDLDVDPFCHNCRLLLCLFTYRVSDQHPAEHWSGGVLVDGVYDDRPVVVSHCDTGWGTVSIAPVGYHITGGCFIPHRVLAASSTALSSKAEKQREIAYYWCLLLTALCSTHRRSRTGSTFSKQSNWSDQKGSYNRKCHLTDVTWVYIERSDTTAISKLSMTLLSI